MFKPYKMIFLCLLVGMLSASPAFADPGPEALKAARAAYDKGDWKKATGLYEKAFETSPKNSVSRVEAALEHGSMLWEQGLYKKAHAKTMTSIKLARALKLERALGRLLLTLGQIETSQGKLATAHRTLVLCVSESKIQKDVIYGALCRLNVSLVRRLQGKSGMNDAQIKKTIASIKAVNTPRATGLAMAKTADLYRKGKNYSQAMQLLTQAQTQFKKAGSVPAQTRNTLRIAQLLQQQNQWPDAQKYAKSTLGALGKMGNRPLLHQAHGVIGRSAQKQGDAKTAQVHYLKALSFARSTGSPQLKAQSHLALCELIAESKTPTRAEPHCLKASSGFRKVGARTLDARALVKVANFRQQQKQLPEAQKLYLKVIKTMSKTSKTPEREKFLAIQQANLCQVEHTLNYTGSYKSCVKALKYLAKLPKSEQPIEYIAATHYAAAFGAEREKRYKQALGHFQQAGSTYASMSSPKWMRAADAQLRLGTLFTQLKRREKQAIAAFELGIGWVKKASEPQAVQVHQQLLLQLSQHLLFNKKYKEAVPKLDQLIAVSTKDPDSQAWAYNGLAQAHLKLGDKAASIKSLKLGLQAVRKGKDRHGIKKLMQNNLKTLQE